MRHPQKRRPIMTRHLGTFTIAVAIFAWTAPSARASLDLHVATDGDDGNAGTREKPFRSLERARDALRELRKKAPLPAGGATVWIHRGVHSRERTLDLTSEDSGSADGPVAFRAAEGEEVRILGGRLIAGWKPVEEPDVLSRLDEKARGRVLQVDLKANGIADPGKLRSRGFGRPTTPSHLELFFEGRRMTLARWPDADSIPIAAPGAVDPAGDGHGGALGKLEAGFHYDGDRPRRWKSARGVWVHGYWAWDWANSYEEVDAIDLERRLVKTKPPHGQYGFRAGQRFYFLNVLEELDSPGEYYVDAERGILYFWPPSPIEKGEAMVSVLESPLVAMKSASRVALSGLILECSRGNGVRIEGGEGDLIEKCAIRNLGNYAVRVEGGSGHSVEGCEVNHTGDGGISFSGGDRKTLKPSGHRGVNNHLHHLAEWSRCYCPAYLVDGVGCVISRNLIHDHPHCAILFSGNEHLIELNEIHHVCLSTGDVGAIYAGRDWTYRGNMIRHNFIHHTGGVGMGSMGVYLDDCVSGETVFGNVFYKVQRAAFIGGGRDNTVENNIFVDCDPAVAIDGRGLDGSPVWHDMVYKFMKEGLESVHPHQPPYSVRYPRLAQLDAYYAKDAGVPPEGNVVARNVAVGKWIQIGWHAAAGMIEVRDNLTDQDPRFVDAPGMNFQLRDDSPAWKLGFKRIPFEEIGLMKESRGR
jgi:parallel beta helix pectate lyase-like protein